MKDIISVIVPVYNVKQYLKRCVNSILAQTKVNLQIILVDDGSTDGSSELCDELKKINDNIVVIHKKNGGLGFARNSGLDVATGDYVSFIDGDDYIENDYYFNLLHELNESNSDTVISGHKKVYKDHTAIFSYSFGNITLDTDISKKIIPLMCGKGLVGDKYLEMSSCMNLYSMDIIASNGLRFYSERKYISEDLLFNIDYFRKSKRVFISQNSGYCYCFNQNSLTQKYLTDRINKQKTMTQKIIDTLINGEEWSQDCEQRILNNYLMWVRACIKLEQKYYKDNGFRNSYKNIKKICNDDFVIESYKRYDNKYSNFPSRIVNSCVKHKLYMVLWLIMYLKNNLGV